MAWRQTTGRLTKRPDVSTVTSERIPAEITTDLSVAPPRIGMHEELLIRNESHGTLGLNKDAHWLRAHCAWEGFPRAFGSGVARGFS